MFVIAITRRQHAGVNLDVQLSKSPKAIFFDFDGVLVESVLLKEKAFRDLFAVYGDDVVRQVIELHRELGAISRVIKIERIHRDLLGHPLSDDELQQWAHRYTDTVEKAVVSCPVVTGAETVLQAQSMQADLFVISGTPEDEMRRIVTARGWNHYFTSVHGSPRLKADIVTDLLQRHKLAAADCLFVGDTFTDHDAAIATGVPFVGRLNGVRANPFPPNTILIDDLNGLAAVLAKSEEGAGHDRE